MLRDSLNVQERLIKSPKSTSKLKITPNRIPIPCIELDCYARGREAEHLRGRSKSLKHLRSRSLSEWQHRRSQFCIEIQSERVKN